VLHAYKVKMVLCNVMHSRTEPILHTIGGVWNLLKWSSISYILLKIFERVKMIWRVKQCTCNNAPPNRIIPGVNILPDAAAMIPGHLRAMRTRCARKRLKHNSQIIASTRSRERPRKVEGVFRLYRKSVEIAERRHNNTGATVE